MDAKVYAAINDLSEESVIDTLCEYGLRNTLRYLYEQDQIDGAAIMLNWECEKDNA